MNNDSPEHRRAPRDIDFRTVDVLFGRYRLSGGTINTSETGVRVCIPERTCVPDRGVCVRFRDGRVIPVAMRWRDRTDIGFEYL